MSAKYLIPVTVFLALILLVSCEKTIEFKSEEIKSKIVVNAVFNAGSTHKYIKIEKSRSVLNDKNYFEALPDAVVKLYEDGEFVSELDYVSAIDTFYENLNYGVVKKYPYERGFYVDSVLEVKPGSTYRLEVARDGFEPVVCETTVPFPVELGEMTVVKEKAPKQHAENYFKIKVRLPIRDPKTETNYYRLVVGQERGYEAALKLFGGYYYGGPGGGYYGGGYGGGYGNSPSIDIDSVVPTDTILQETIYNQFVFSFDPVLSASGNTDIMETGDNGVDFFTDELINNGTHELAFWIESWRDVYTEIGEYLNVQSHVLSLSPELYFYSISQKQHLLASDNPFAEPVPVYSNVTGGMGIFGSFAAGSRSSLIGDYPVEGKTYIGKDEYFRQQY
ncbi:MAG: DUF4249 domain-containing protein [Prolixibacteraceae bacterium]